MEDETQEIAETVEEVIEAPAAEVAEIVEELPVEELPAEVIADPSNWSLAWDGYLIGLDWLFPFLMAVAAYIILRHLIWNSLRFNYHHYLECGEFVLCWGDDGGNHEKKERRLALSKTLDCEEDFVSWFAALTMSLVVIAIHVLIALAWPITVILVFPLATVRLIAYRKRQKIAFKQKLNGDHLRKEASI
jgi:hypothetical protein